MSDLKPVDFFPEPVHVASSLDAMGWEELEEAAGVWMHFGEEIENYLPTKEAMAASRKSIAQLLQEGDTGIVKDIASLYHELRMNCDQEYKESVLLESRIEAAVKEGILSASAAAAPMPKQDVRGAVQLALREEDIHVPHAKTHEAD